MDLHVVSAEDFANLAIPCVAPTVPPCMPFGQALAYLQGVRQHIFRINFQKISACASNAVNHTSRTYVAVSAV